VAGPDQQRFFRFMPSRSAGHHDFTRNGKTAVTRSNLNLAAESLAPSKYRRDFARARARDSPRERLRPRDPYPLDASNQEIRFSELPPEPRRIALFAVNTDLERSRILHTSVVTADPCPRTRYLSAQTGCLHITHWPCQRETSSRSDTKRCCPSDPGWYQGSTPTLCAYLQTGRLAPPPEPGLRNKLTV
jgi:hypothetical protein